MHTVKLKLVTVIANRLIADELIAVILRLGAKGYTVAEVSGQGSRGLQPLDWEGKNSRIESIVSPDVAERIIEHLAETYFGHPGIVAFQQDVEVVRSEKFV